MIFSIGNHIELIKEGKKKQTRRKSDRYSEDKLYSIQPCRTCKGITEGKILIVNKWIEEQNWFGSFSMFKISNEDAEAEGGYTPKEFEELYEKIHPKWRKRTVYEFEYVRKEPIKAFVYPDSL